MPSSSLVRTGVGATAARGRERVVARATVVRDPPCEVVRERLPEILAAGALRRSLREIFVAEGPPEGALVDPAPRRARAGLVEPFAVALGDQVAQDVRWPGVERDHAIGVRFGNESEVRDTAEIQQSDGRALAKQDEVGEMDTASPEAAARIRFRRSSS